LVLFLTTPKTLKVYHCYVLVSLIAASSLMVMFVRENLGNLALITENVPPYGYALMAVVKSTCILFTKAEFKDLMETLNELFPKTKEEQNIFKVRKYFKNYKRIERIFAVMVGSAAINFVIAKLLKFAITGIWYDKLPFENWFPFDENDPKFYNLVFLWQLHNTVVTICSLLGSDLILYSFITLLTMQFDNLSQQLEKFTLSDDIKKIIELVDLHETLMRLSRNLEIIFSVSILFNFVASSILICLVGYEVSIGISFELLLKFSILLTASLLQILMLCYYGQKLTNAADNLRVAAYNSEWFGKNDRKLKSAMLMIIQRSQKPFVISAFKFTAVNLKAFTTVSF
jgi:odorant receptor